MPSMKALKRRIASVKNTQKIMKAMKLVATSKVQRLKGKMEAVRPMFSETKDFIKAGVQDSAAFESPFYEIRQVNKTAYVVIAAERGLCGSYKVNVLKETLKHINENNKSERIVAVGGKCKEYFLHRERTVASEYKGVVEHASFATARTIASELIEMFTTADSDKRVDEVYIAYTKFETLLSHIPTIEKILPLEVAEESSGIQKENLYEPDLQMYLKKAVPAYLTMFVYGAMVDAAVCEQASRMTSMDAASRNAGEIVDKLTLQYNRQRQGAITQEISEIVGGANAV